MKESFTQLLRAHFAERALDMHRARKRWPEISAKTVEKHVRRELRQIHAATLL